MIMFYLFLRFIKKHLSVFNDLKIILVFIDLRQLQFRNLSVHCTFNFLSCKALKITKFVLRVLYTS